MSNDYSLVHVLKTLSKWKKHIFIATGLVALASIIGSLLMPNYYKSSTLLYAASPTIANPDPIGGGEKLYYIYGTGEDLDRLFSIANSSEAKSHLINSFNLAEHYGIDTSSLKGKAKLSNKLNKLYETTKTKFDGLLLTIEDTDRARARDMVRSAREYIEQKANTLLKQSQANLIESLSDGIKNQEQVLKITGDTLTKLKNKYEIFESYAQAQSYGELVASSEAELVGKEATLTEMLKYRGIPRDSINKLKAKIEGIKSKKAILETRTKRFNEGVLTVRQLEVAHSAKVSELTNEKERLKKLEASYNKAFTAVHIVERETMPVEKSRPKRSLIVLGLTMLAFVLSSLAVLLIEGTKDVNWREIYAGN